MRSTLSDHMFGITKELESLLCAMASPHIVAGLLMAPEQLKSAHCSKWGFSDTKAGGKAPS